MGQSMNAYFCFCNECSENAFDGTLAASTRIPSDLWLKVILPFLDDDYALLDKAAEAQIAGE